MPILGMKNPRQVRSCAGAIGWQLSHDERTHIKKAVKKQADKEYECSIRNIAKSPPPRVVLYFARLIFPLGNTRSSSTG
jgi:hypothetical protein